MKKPILIALASALITAGAIKAAPAFAQTAPLEGEVQVSLVRTADLDLRSEAGQRELDQRLARAAREVCGEASNADLVGQNDVRQCRDDVLAKAHAQRDQLFAAADRGAVIAITAAR